jgi:hypothetical protein
MTDRLIRRDPGPSAADVLGEIFLTEKQLASRHQLSVKTLRNARVTGTYIRFVRLGRTVRYRLSDIIAYEEQTWCAPPVTAPPTRSSSHCGPRLKLGIRPC